MAKMKLFILILNKYFYKNVLFFVNTIYILHILYFIG